MDNVRFHKVQGVTSLIGSTGARCIYQPPYHAELNPIEEMWSKIKILLRRCGARTLNDFQKSIRFAFGDVAPSDLEGWFQQADL